MSAPEASADSSALCAAGCLEASIQSRSPSDTGRARSAHGSTARAEAGSSVRAATIRYRDMPLLLGKHTMVVQQVERHFFFYGSVAEEAEMIQSCGIETRRPGARATFLTT